MADHLEDNIRAAAAIQYELDAVTSLVVEGLAALRRQKFAITGLEPMLANMAPGLERLSKLGLGLIAVDDGEPFPKWGGSKGHEISNLVSDLENTIVERACNSTAPGWVRQLAAEAEGSRDLFDAFTDMLQRHAKQGRYVNLTRASFPPESSQKTDPSPMELWEDLTSVVTDNDEAVLLMLNSDWDRAVSIIHERIAVAVERWVWLVRAAWDTGVIGEHAHGWAGLPPHFPKATH